MKERLSAILTKTLKGKEKNWQSLARESGSSSSGQTSETAAKSADAEILAAIDAIEFDFGPERYTTAQAGLLFTYEMGFDLDRLYVIALSVNCGTVIFYIPDELVGRIVERAGELHCRAGKYLADLIEFRRSVETAIESMAAAGLAVDEAVRASWMLAEAAESTTHSTEAATVAFMELGKALHAAYTPDARKENQITG